MAEQCPLYRTPDGRPIDPGSNFCRRLRVGLRRYPCRECGLIEAPPLKAAPAPANHKLLSLEELLGSPPAGEEFLMETTVERQPEEVGAAAPEAGPEEKLHQALQRLRLERGLEIKQVAAKIGVSLSAVRIWEKGSAKPSSFSLGKLDELFDGQLLPGREVLSPAADESDPTPDEVLVGDEPPPVPEAADGAAEEESDPNRTAKPIRVPGVIAAEEIENPVAAPAVSDVPVGGPVDWMLAELARAEAKHPHWPADPVHAAAILAEESGELTQAALDFYYGQGSLQRMKEEAIQCGAMALRFLENLGLYHDRPFGDSRAATVAGIAADLRGILERLDGRP